VPAPHKVVEAVLTGQADIAVIPIPRPSGRCGWCGCARSPWRSSAIPTPPSPAAGRRPAELAGQAFVAFDPGLTIRKAIDRALRSTSAREHRHGVRQHRTIKQAIIIAEGNQHPAARTVQKEASIRTLATVDLAVPDLVRPWGSCTDDRRAHADGRAVRADAAGDQ